MIDHKTLDALHKKIPVDFYHGGIKRNIFQRVWHKKRFNEILKMIKQLGITTGDKILDLGCNTAYLSHMVSNATGADVTGMDISDKAIEWAREKYGKNITLIAQDISKDLPFNENTFTLVMAFDVLEHIIDLEKTILSVRKILKDQGIFIVSFPIENFLFKIIWRVWTTTKGKVLKGIHVRNITSKTMTQLLAQHGFRKISERSTHLSMWYLGTFQLSKK